MLKTNCKNCAAPLNWSESNCLYCGTQYRQLSPTIGRPGTMIEIRGHDNNVRLTDVIARIENANTLVLQNQIELLDLHAERNRLKWRHSMLMGLLSAARIVC